MRPLKVPEMIVILSILSLAFGSSCAFASQTNVAVAANFTEPAKEIAREFAKETGHEAVLSFGTSGQFFNQILQDAPLQVFLSADSERPKKLVDQGLAVAESRFTYAIGKLVLWSRTPQLDLGVNTLKESKFATLAIANPATAPYGAAAVEAMNALGVYEPLRAKIVQGNSVAQAFQFVDTGNAELGFVALSQIVGNTSGSRWMVSNDLYTPIRQDAVLLKKGASNDAAVSFVTFLRGPNARAIIEKFGYALGN